MSTGLAYLRVRAERLVDDPVLGSGTLVTYIAEVVVRNEDSVTIEVKDLRFELPMSVEVMGECGSDHSTTVVEEASSPGGSASKALCLTQLSLPPNEEVRLSGGYSLDNDILLGREDFMRSGWVISYYVPAGTERHVVISGHVFLTDIAEERAWEVLGRAHVIAVVRVVGEAYGGGGSFSTAVAVNATLGAAPDSSYYYVGPYGHIIAGSNEVSEVFSVGEG